MADEPSLAYVYVIGTTDGPTKIGHSLAPERRLKDFRRAGHKAFLTGTWPVGSGIALSVERYIHWQLREHHIRGEWFNVPREKVSAAIQKAMERLDQFDRGYPIPALDQPGKALRYGEHIATKYPEGTKDRISGALNEGEVQAAFIREAVERELVRREKEKAKKR